MAFFEIYINSLAVIMMMMTCLWIASVFLRNVSIVDIFWGFGFVLAGWVYFYYSGGYEARKIMLMILATVWGLRLSVFLAWRNIGKGEDFRYQQFRKNYGPKYWWLSYFQTFMLQGILMWVISAPLLGAQYLNRSLNVYDLIGIIFWAIGIIFEAGGDYQLMRFKSDPSNKGKVLDTGFWRYTRHPNYFGDASVWWGFGFISIAAGSFSPVIGSMLMTALIIKVSGVQLLEKTLKNSKPQYQDYIRRTSSFIPWFPRK